MIMDLLLKIQKAAKEWGRIDKTIWQNVGSWLKLGGNTWHS